LSTFIQKYYHTTLTKRDMSLRGWNWGVADFIGECRVFEVITQYTHMVILLCDSKTAKSGSPENG